MERCDCKTGGPCLKLRGELPENQTCVENRKEPCGCTYACAAAGGQLAADKECVG
jgi:hypothetical protein